jgi:hypothetical protein
MKSSAREADLDAAGGSTKREDHGIEAAAAPFPR